MLTGHMRTLLYRHAMRMHPGKQRSPRKRQDTPTNRMQRARVHQGAMTMQSRPMPAWQSRRVIMQGQAPSTQWFPSCQVTARISGTESGHLASHDTSLL